MESNRGEGKRREIGVLVFKKMEVVFMSNQNSNQFQVGGAKARFVLIICSLLFAVNYMDRLVMSVVLQPMKIDLGLTDAQVGYINGAFFLGVAIFSMPVARIIDVWSRKKMIGLLAVIWSIFTFATGRAAGFASLLTLRLGVGIGEAGFAPGGTALISASYPPEKRGGKLGVFNTFITVGVIFGLILGGYLSANYGGWRTPFYVFAIPGIILGILAFFMQDYSLKEADGSAVVHDSLGSTLKQLFKIPTLRWLYAGLAMYILVQYGVMTWFPALLMRAFEIKEDKAGLIMAGVTVIGILGPILGGIIADKWGKKVGGGRMRLAGLSIGIAIFLLMLTLLFTIDLTNRNLMIFSMTMMPIYSIFIGMATPAISATSQDVVSAKMRGLAWGAGIMVAFLIGGTLGPIIVGKVADITGGGYQGLAKGFLVVGLFGLIGSWCWFMAARHVESDKQKIDSE
jgi:MFS family permease